MSAYMIDRNHVNYLVEAAMSYRLFGQNHSHLRWRGGELHAGDYDQATKVGQMLWDENLKSILARYPDCSLDNLPGPIGEDFVYKHESRPHAVFEPPQIIMSCRCCDYQSCEHEGWEASEAKAFIDALEAAAAQSVDGYDDAIWGAPKQPATV